LLQKKMDLPECLWGEIYKYLDHVTRGFAQTGHERFLMLGPERFGSRVLLKYAREGRVPQALCFFRILDEGRFELLTDDMVAMHACDGFLRAFIRHDRLALVKRYLSHDGAHPLEWLHAACCYGRVHIFEWLDALFPQGVPLFYIQCALQNDQFEMAEFVARRFSRDITYELVFNLSIGASDALLGFCWTRFSHTDRQSMVERQDIRIWDWCVRTGKTCMLPQHCNDWICFHRMKLLMRNQQLLAIVAQRHVKKEKRRAKLVACMQQDEDIECDYNEVLPWAARLENKCMVEVCLAKGARATSVECSATFARWLVDRTTIDNALEIAIEQDNVPLFTWSLEQAQDRCALALAAIAGCAEHCATHALRTARPPLERVVRIHTESSLVTSSLEWWKQASLVQWVALQFYQTNVLPELRHPPFRYSFEANRFH
jgi:hypothetical protein